MSDDAWTYEDCNPACMHVWADVSATYCECTKCEGYAYLG